MRLYISVTQENIDKGQRADCSFCPVALAVKRVVERYDVFVSPAGARFGKVPDHVLVPLPRSATRFIRRFDRKALVEPFNFWMDIPESVLRK